MRLDHTIDYGAGCSAGHDPGLGQYGDSFAGAVPNTLEKFAKLILGNGVIPVPVKAQQLDGLLIAPSYAGFSAAVEKQHVTVRTSIPVETFRGFVQIGMFVRQLQAQ